MSLSDTDLVHLRSCVDLAHEAVEAGDEPFGSVLVDASGVVRFSDRNRVSGGDETRHPELMIVEWAVANMTAEERRTSTVYTSGEHCPMCSAAHAWVGLGRIVYAVSSAQLVGWLTEWGIGPAVVNPLPINSVAPGVPAEGPAPELADEMKALHRRPAQPAGGGAAFVVDPPGP